MLFKKMIFHFSSTPQIFIELKGKPIFQIEFLYNQYPVTRAWEGRLLFEEPRVKFF